MSRLFCWFAVTLATAVLGAGLAWAAGGWRIEPTARQRVSLSAISCPSATRCWAVGVTRSFVQPRRLPVLELWNGHRWTVVTLPSPPGLRLRWFSDLSCASVRFCMAVGGEERRRSPYGSPFAELWDGRTWTNEPMVSPVKQNAVVTSVSCISSATCVAVGTVGGRGFAQRWNGRDWRTIRPPIVEPGDLSCMSAAACIAGVVRANGPGAQLWNGRRWIPQAIPIPSGIVPYRRTVAALTSLSCPAARRCVGLASIQTGSSSTAELTAIWNGRNWTSAVIPGASTVSDLAGSFGLFGISCRSARACVAVGSNSSDPIAALWSGHTWAVQILPKPAANQSAALYQVSCHTARSCMAIGSSGNEPAGTLRDPLAERYQG